MELFTNFEENQSIEEGKKPNKKKSGCLGCLGCFGVFLLLVVVLFFGVGYYFINMLVSPSPLVSYKETISNELKESLKEKLQNAKKSFKGSSSEVYLEFSEKEINYLLNKVNPNIITKTTFNKDNILFKFSQKLDNQKYINAQIEGNIKIDNFEMKADIRKFSIGKIDITPNYQEPILKLLLEMIENNLQYDNEKIKLMELKLENNNVKIKLVKAN